MMLALLSRRRNGRKGRAARPPRRLSNRIGDRTVATSSRGTSSRAWCHGHGGRRRRSDGPESDRNSRCSTPRGKKSPRARSAPSRDSRSCGRTRPACSRLFGQAVRPQSTRASCRTAHTQAIEIERISDDPRPGADMACHGDRHAVRELDRQLLLDLLRLEPDPARGVRCRPSWWPRSRADRVGEFAHADQRCRRWRTSGALRDALITAARDTRDGEVAAGPLIRISSSLRKVDDRDVLSLSRLAHTLGPGVIRPLAEALAAEEHKRALRRLREYCWGSARLVASRSSGEALPPTRRAPHGNRAAARVGGREALPSSPRCSMMRIRRCSARPSAPSPDRDPGSFAVSSAPLVGGESQARAQFSSNCWVCVMTRVAAALLRARPYAAARKARGHARGDHRGARRPEQPFEYTGY